MSRQEKAKGSQNKVFISIPNAAKRTGYSLRHFYRKYPVEKIFRIGRAQYCIIFELDEWAKNNPKPSHFN